MRWWTLRKLESDDPQKRRQAVDELRRAGGAKAAMELVRTLGDEDPGVRERAAQALDAVGGSQAVDYCITTLVTGEDLHARVCAARALGILRDPAGLSVLQDRLLRDAPPVRQAAAIALEHLGWEPGDSQERILFAIGLGRYEEAAQAGPEAVALLLDVFFDAPWYVPPGLAKALADLGEPAARALRAGPEAQDRWDAFAEGADALRRNWRQVAEQVSELRSTQAVTTKEIKGPARSTLNLATDLDAHLVDPNTGERFDGGPREPIGRFRGLSHECPFCSAPERSLSLDDVARECLTRDHRMTPCRSCGTFYLIPASIFAPGSLSRLAGHSHHLARMVSEMAYHELLLPDWGVAVFQANTLAPTDLSRLPWDGQDPCPMCRSQADDSDRIVRIRCRGCRTGLKLRPSDISRSAETMVRCKRCQSPTLIPPTVWCPLCQKGLLPPAVVMKMTIGVG